MDKTLFESLRKEAFNAVSNHEKKAYDISDSIWANPELGNEEFFASAALTDELKANGFTVEMPFCGLPTAFKAVYGSNTHKHKVALLAEYDALEGMGHACGHCASGSASVLAAIALSQLQDRLDTDIHVIGTPAEETNGAKCAMAEHGAFDGYDFAIMAHMGDANSPTAFFLAIGEFLYEFHGQAAHAAAAPWEGVNAFNAAQLMLHGADMLRQHVKPDVRIHGIMKSCGTAANIVPDYCSVHMVIRSADAGYLDTVIAKVDNCATGGAIATGATWEKSPLIDRYCDLKQNKSGIELVKENFAELGLDWVTKECSGSSDIGNVSYRCPAFHPYIKAVPEGTPAHSPAFRDAMNQPLAHEGITNAAKVMILQVLKAELDQSLLEHIKADFEN